MYTLLPFRIAGAMWLESAVPFGMMAGCPGWKKTALEKG